MQSNRESSGFRQKLGTFFGISSGSSRPEEQWNQDSVIVFTEEVIKDVGPGSPIQVRVKILKELQDAVANKRLEQYAIQRLWLSIKDLLEPSVPMEIRHYVFGFIRSLIGGQYEELGMLRAHFLKVVDEHDIREDFQPCFDVVRTLTDSGKNIVHLEQEMGPYLAKIIARAMGSGRSIEYLTMVLNVIKHNAAYLDEEVLLKIIEGCCHCAINSSQLAVTELCLDSLNAIVCYSTLPNSALSNFIMTLCFTLNHSKLSRQTLQMMMRLLGTHVGMATIYTLCTILQNKSNWGNPLILRGGVFFISMSLWGVRKVESLKVSYGSVLPAIRQASSCTHTLVIYEIALSILRLIREYADVLQSMEWDLVYDILSNIKVHIRQFTLQDNYQLLQVFHEVFKILSEHHSLLDHANSKVNPKRFFEVVSIDTSVHELTIVMKLLMYHAMSVRIGEHGWTEKYKEFMGRFYVSERDTAVRIEALNQLENVVSIHTITYEDELLKDVVLPLLSPIAQDPNPEICCRGVQLLITVLNECTPSWAPLVLGIISNVLQRGLEIAARVISDDEEEFKLSAMKSSILGLTPLIKAKLPRCSDVSVQIFQLLVTYLLQLYDEDLIIPATSVVRREIISCILSLRGNEDGYVGYRDDDGTTTYSSFYVCQRPTQEVEGSDNDDDDVIIDTDDDDVIIKEEAGPSYTNSLITYLDYSKVSLCVLSCLTKEKEVDVIVKLLVGLRGVLENRTIVYPSWSDFSSICCQLCSITDSQSDWIRSLKNKPNSRFEDTLSNYLYPILVSLCTYGSVLDRHAQHQLVCSLERGVVKQCGLLCVRALSLAVLELQSTMTRLLPRVLYRLGQVSATPTMALPVLELLGNVICLPHLYRGFVEQQYLGVFGIVLLYADPFKYSSYVVTLAYHVISIWFVRCRIQYRPTVAQFINKQLNAILSVYEEVNSPTTVTIATTEPRKRSSSFTLSHPQSVNRQRSQTYVGSGSGSSSGNENNLLKEMIELCVDMMARYTYSNISTQPTRSPGADFLVGNGPSKTWLLGNSLVTITTSGTGGGSVGVCSRCQVLQKSLQPNPDVLLESNKSFVTNFRRMSLSTDDVDNDQTTPTPCSCWCRGWCEVKVRRPTGNVAWLMRVQNKLDILATSEDQSQQNIKRDSQFDWSLMGINTTTPPRTIPEHEKEEGGVNDKEDEWDMIETEHIEGDESKNLIGQSVGQSNDSTINQSHDQSCDHEASSETHSQSNDQSHVSESDDQSIDQLEKSCDENKPSCDHEASSETRSQLNVSGSNDQEKSCDEEEQSCDQLEPSDDKPMKEQDHYKDDDDRTHVSVYMKAIGVSIRQPSSHSWSEGGGGADMDVHDDIKPTFKQRMHSTRSSSFTGSSIELLPPLFSYDESNPATRSPSLLREDELSDPEQFNLIRRASNSLSDSKIDELDRSLSLDINNSNSSDDDSNVSPVTTDNTNTSTNTATPTTNTTPEHRQPAPAAVTPTIIPPGVTTTLPVVTVSTPKRPLSAPSPKKPTIITTPPATAPRKRVHFSNPSSSVSSLREELPADVYNNPSFIFLQLYHSSSLGVQSPDQPPVLLPTSESIERAIKVMDHIPPYNTHKVGVVYVGEDQDTEQAILCNTHGSSRYQHFIKSLGQLIQLKECTSNLVYLGGLDTTGTDGRVACYWEDDITQVIFHVATLMPTHPSNPSCSNKKLHIGNDFVTIVYNDSGKKYKFGTIKGQFNFAEVMIEPLGGGVNTVYLSVKDSLSNMLDSTPFLVSDRWLPLLARQKAILANLASLVLLSESSPNSYPSNWLGRLRQIKHIRERTLERFQSSSDRTKGAQSSQTMVHDFVPYC